MKDACARQSVSGTGRLLEAEETARRYLLDARDGEPCWTGRLSSSALATATAVSALSLASRERFADLIGGGVQWLRGDQNPDGGWGDTPESPSNIPTTMLAEAALTLSGREAAPCLHRAETYLGRHAGEDAAERIETLQDIYGSDRTFAAPILANCALAAEDGADEVPGGIAVDWSKVPGLPFELGCLPHGLLRALQLGVVSYALPALIAIGQLIHLRSPGAGPLRRLTRLLTKKPTLRRLERIQPESGGFLEAIPLTSFVTMSLAATGRTGHTVCRKGVEFIRDRRRSDGSWAIDTNLSHWVTTLSVHALDAGGREAPDEAGDLRRWIVEQQYRSVHPYTDSPPGGWAWTPLPGGVPDADDTAGALLSLAKLGQSHTDSPRAGIDWLLHLQNSDGGWPTFCPGWGKLPFDRSAPDLTAHALRALDAWDDILEPRRAESVVEDGFGYLQDGQRGDGSWVPLWFGNQSAPDLENPVYGTSRALLAYRDLGRDEAEQARRGRQFLMGAQNPDGSWGGAPGVQGSMEETGLAVSALAHRARDEAVRKACLSGCRYLAERVEEGGLEEPAPIGLYFARLWYAEDLYPAIWATAGLGSVLRRVGRDDASGRGDMRTMEAVQ